MSSPPVQVPPAAHLELRASDGDREAAISLLRDHTAAGRLTVEELSARIDEAYAARSLGQLRDVLRELPEPAPPPAPGRPAAVASSDREASRRRGAVLAFVLVNTLLIAIWALTGAGYFWPMWPLLGWGLGLLGELRGHPGHRRSPGSCGRRRVARGPSA